MARWRRRGRGWTRFAWGLWARDVWRRPSRRASSEQVGRVGPRAWEPGASDARAVCEGRVHLPGAHLRGGMRVAEPLGEERGPQGSPPRGVVRVRRGGPAGRGPGRIADAAPADFLLSTAARGVRGRSWLSPGGP